MVVSYLVRLIPEQLAEGRFVGQVEHVATGAVTTVRDLDELAAALRSSPETDEPDVSAPA